MSTCKLFIGGLSWNTSDESLRSKFEEFGAVDEAIVIKDRDTGRSRGFGFVTFQTTEEAEAAIEALHDKDFEGRVIRVDKAGERPAGGNGGSGGYRRGGGFRSDRSFGGDSGRRGSDRPYGDRSSFGGGDRAGGERAGGYRPRDGGAPGERTNFYRNRDL